METELVSWLRERLAGHPRLQIGVGDDAAVLNRSGCETVVTCDLLTDHVDFDLAHISAERAGRKALAVNLSDLAAMAARPVAAVVAVALPRQGAFELAVEIYQGMLPLAEKFDVVIAGGDTNTWDGRLVISVTAIGELTSQGALVRSGARPGDQILATGTFGGSILGRHLDFDPRVEEALQLHASYQLHAGIDVSDGLSLDLSRMAEASGCGALLELDQIPISQAARELSGDGVDGQSALDHALSDGEDFELILAVPASAAERLLREQPIAAPVSRIGQFVDQNGLWSVRADGTRAPLVPRGFKH